jgi:hypothetical protein
MFGMEEVEGPAAVLMAEGYYDFDGFTDAAVGFDSGVAQVIEAAQDVVVPKRRDNLLPVTGVSRSSRTLRVRASIST